MSEVSAKQTIVVKIGGEVVGSGEAAVLAADLRELVGGGARVAIVHGGGPQATELQKRLGIETKQVAGRRITDPATLDVMKMAIAGKLNVDLCAILIAAGLSPVGPWTGRRRSSRPWQAAPTRSRMRTRR
jgi:acetylglutamate kinase